MDPDGAPTGDVETRRDRPGSLVSPGAEAPGWQFLLGLEQRYAQLVRLVLSDDLLEGDIDFQVWPLGSKPNWNVPSDSPAYQSGIDLSKSFTLRNTTYAKLPGMEPGYFPGDAPNMGAVQNE